MIQMGRRVPGGAAEALVRATIRRAEGRPLRGRLDAAATGPRRLGSAAYLPVPCGGWVRLPAPRSLTRRSDEADVPMVPRLPSWIGVPAPRSFTLNRRSVSVCSRRSQGCRSRCWSQRGGVAGGGTSGYGRGASCCGRGGESEDRARGEPRRLGAGGSALVMSRTRSAGPASGPASHNR